MRKVIMLIKQQIRAGTSRKAMGLKSAELPPFADLHVLINDSQTARQAAAGQLWRGSLS
jgi:hypothetical protein